MDVTFSSLLSQILDTLSHFYPVKKVKNLLTYFPILSGFYPKRKGLTNLWTLSSQARKMLSLSCTWEQKKLVLSELFPRKLFPFSQLSWAQPTFLFLSQLFDALSHFCRVIKHHQQKFTTNTLCVLCTCSGLELTLSNRHNQRKDRIKFIYLPAA